MPIMCIIGNPPYSGESANKGKWIMGLMEAYKKEPGGKEKLKERNPKWINDDYVKFIRLSEHLIEKNGEGVLGFITNHGYLDNPTFRGMRWHLMKTFDKIYVLDLHGNSKKKEVTPEGKPDKNVFDIMQGVAIIIAVKRKAVAESKPLAEVFHRDLWGTREKKYLTLWGAKIHSEQENLVYPRSPEFSFFNHDHKLRETYSDGFAVNEFFRNGTLGFQTHRDKFAISDDINELRKRISDLRNDQITDYALEAKYDLKTNTDWTIREARELAKSVSDEGLFVTCEYRPFDKRWMIFSSIAIDRLRLEFNRHIINRHNLTLCLPRQLSFSGYRHVIVSNIAAESCLISNKTKEGNVNFALYNYEDIDSSRRVNFDPKLYKTLQDLATDDTHQTPDEVAVFDYIYGVLHCPAYRQSYAEFLKIDFPRIPWPHSPAEFWDISGKGGQLRRLHLMEPTAIGSAPYAFRGEGDNVVSGLRFEGGSVWINDTQYFENVPDISWSFYIGGYQPAQKWLKDRKGRALNFDDVRHYQNIIKILSETDRIMRTITMTLAT